MADVLEALPWFLFAGAAFFAFYFHHEAEHYKREWYALLNKPLIFWQERDIRRQLKKNLHWFDLVIRDGSARMEPPFPTEEPRFDIVSPRKNV